MSIFSTKILLATDGSEEADFAAQAAVQLANETGSELHVVLVGPSIVRQVGLVGSQDDLDREAKRSLEAQVEKVKAAGGTVIQEQQAHLRIGRPDAEIISLAEEIGAGLIVMGSRGLGGMRRVLLGSVSESVVHHAHCPVLVVRREEKDQEAAGIFPMKILLATDGSEEATLAARTAVDLAEKTGSELHLVHSRTGPMLTEAGYDAWSITSGAEGTVGREAQTVTKEAQEVLDNQVEQIKAAGGKVAQTHAKLGHPIEEIIIVAEELGAGLIVMGSRGLGRMKRALIGSVSESVVRHAHCPVLVVRSSIKA